MQGAAYDAIGEARADDYSLAARGRAGRLPEHAGALKRLLQRDEVAVLMNQYGEFDHMAVAAQMRFRQLARWETISRWLDTFARPLAFLLAAIVLLGSQYTWNLSLGAFDLINNDPIVSRIGFFIEMIPVIIILIVHFILASTRAYEKWVAARALAEDARRKLIDYLMHEDEPTRSGELPLLPLKLEYFRRFHLDIYRHYLKFRAPHQESEAGNSRDFRITISSLMILVVVWVMAWTATHLGYLKWETSMLERSFFVFSFFLVVALGSKKEPSSLLYAKRQALVNTTILANLDWIVENQLEPARAAAASGDAIAVQRFIQAVQGQIQAEAIGVVPLEGSAAVI